MTLAVPVDMPRLLLNSSVAARRRAGTEPPVALRDEECQYGHAGAHVATANVDDYPMPDREVDHWP